MSLTGSLKTMPLAEVLGWIGSTNRRGVLTVRGVGSETTLHLRRGRIVECAAVDPPARLGQFLLFHGVIDEEVLDRAMRAHAAQGRRLGEVLLEMGAVGREDLEEALTAKAEETVLGSFDHATGWFTFDPDLASLEAPQQVDMAIADAIARGGPRVESAALAAAALKRPGAVLRKTAKAPSAKLGSVWPLRSAYALVDGRRSIDEIVLHMHGTEFHVIQRLHQLVVEGFLEVVDLAESTPSREATGDAVGPTETTEPPTGADADRVDVVEALDGITFTALPSGFVRHSENLSTIEKYILTLCDGTRDLQRITSVAPIQTQVVVNTIRSLKDRGWLKAGPVADH